ncbi:hypothetical protein Q7P35_007510 [Cladosporium inversicolor]
MPTIIVITCPSGKQSSHLIQRLYAAEQTFPSSFTLRLAAHSDASAANLASTYPFAEIVQTDLSDLSACIALLKNTTSVYHVGPSFHSREKEMGLNMIDAAVHESSRPGNTFQHFVFSSVLSTQHRSLMQHDLKSYVEERLMLSPINWTILQPTNFMDAYPVALFAKQESPVMERLWDPKTANSLIALRDLAEAAEKVLREGSAHYFAQYPLCSTMPVSDQSVADEIAKKLGKTIEVRTPSFENGLAHTLAYLFGGEDRVRASELYAGRDQKTGITASGGEMRRDITRDEAARLCLFYNHRGLVGNPSVLRWLLGREPTGLEEWVESQLVGASQSLGTKVRNGVH